MARKIGKSTSWDKGLAQKATRGIANMFTGAKKQSKVSKIGSKSSLKGINRGAKTHKGRSGGF